MHTHNMGYTTTKLNFKAQQVGVALVEFISISNLGGLVLIYTVGAPVFCLMEIRPHVCESGSMYMYMYMYPTTCTHGMSLRLIAPSPLHEIP